MSIRIRFAPALVLGAALPLAFAATLVHAQDADTSAPAADSQQESAAPGQPGSPAEYPRRDQGLAAATLEDAEAYFTAPLHWNGRDWEYFGGALAVIAIAHHYDTQARTHFDSGSRSPLGPKES